MWLLLLQACSDYTVNPSTEEPTAELEESANTLAWLAE
jgi:hypothetical protein